MESTLAWEVGIEYGLCAVARAAELGVEIAVVHCGQGEKAGRDRALYTANDLGLAGNVVWQSGRRCGDAHEDADVFLESSVLRRDRTLVIEMMRRGLPVVCTDAGGMREAVRDGIDGFVVPVRDVDAMAEALVKLAQDPELRRRMGEAARQRVLEEFTLEKQTREWRAVYEGLLQECGH